MMPVSLCGPPSTFMRLMSEVKNGLANVFAYLDDAIVYSKSEKDGREHLQVFFQCLYDYRLPLNHFLTVLFRHDPFFGLLRLIFESRPILWEQLL